MPSSTPVNFLVDDLPPVRLGAGLFAKQRREEGLWRTQ